MYKSILLTGLVLAGTTNATDNVPPRNPWVADAAYAISHHDPAQSDSTPVDGPRLSKQLTAADVKTVPVVWTSAPVYKHIGDETVVIGANPLGIIKIRATGEDFTEVSNVPYPGIEHYHSDVSTQDIVEIMNQIDHRRRNKQDIRLMLNTWWMYYKLNVNLRTMPNGSYSVIDKEGYHYTNFDKYHLVKSFDNNEVDAPMVPVKHANIVAQLPEEVQENVKYLLGITMTSDGHLVASATGAIMVVDRDLNLKDYVSFPGEWVENSIAADENGGIYVVTSQRMHKLVWNGESLSQAPGDGAWSSPYNVMPEGEAQAMGASSHGSGTTPSLMGFSDDADKLVVISDGDPEGANVVAFWRDKIPDDFEQKPGTKSRRIADQIRLPFAAKTTVDASLATFEDGVIAINTT